MSKNGPGDAGILELICRNLASKGTARFIEDILRGNFEAITEKLAREREIERWRGDYNLY